MSCLDAFSSVGMLLLLSLLVCGGLADQTHPAARKLAATTTATLEECLAGSKTAFPGSSLYETSRTVFNLRYRYRPAVFVFPSTVAQVQNAIKCSVQLGIGIAPRGGGHSYEDYSLGGRDGVIVVDMVAFNSITYNKTTGTATVGAGVRLGPLKIALWNFAKVTVPSGSCVTVGVGGHAIGGGWGFTSRKQGILADSIVEAQVVAANGTIVTANAQQNSDLYWALKGAGANSFGIVTQFTFHAYDVSKPVTYFIYRFTKSQQVATVKAFQIWGLSAVAEVSASLYLDPSGGNNFNGLYLGPESKLASVVKNFLANVPTPNSQNVTVMDYITAVMIMGGFKQTDSPTLLNLQNYTYPTATFKAKSIFVKNPGLSDAGIQSFVSTLQNTATDGYVIFDLYGGSHSNINKIASSASAWVHRDSLYSVQLLSSWQSHPGNQIKDIQFINNIYQALRKYASAESCQNYIDSDMSLSAYYGSNLNRLIAVKGSWDPKNVFNFNQSIPLNS